MPSSGKTSASAAIAAAGLHRVARLGRLGQRLRRRRLALGGVDRGEQRLERELDVGDDRVAHRRPRGLVGIARDRHQRGALGQQRPGDVRVVGEDRGAGDEDQVVTGERLGDAGRRRAGARPGSARGPRGSRPGRRRWRAPTTPAAAPSRPARPRRPSRRSRRCPRRRRRRGSPPPSAAARAPRTSAGSAPARPSTVRVVWWRTASSSTSARQSSIGIETNTGPCGGSAARWVARASACGTSSARGGS